MSRKNCEDCGAIFTGSGRFCYECTLDHISSREEEAEQREAEDVARGESEADAPIDPAMKLLRLVAESETNVQLMEAENELLREDILRKQGQLQAIDSVQRFLMADKNIDPAFKNLNIQA